MFYRLLYNLLKQLVSISFNILNLLLAGNLPPMTCVGVVVEENGLYLVIERADGSLSFPAGFIRWREQPEQAALREAKEETGLSLRLTGVLGHYPMLSDSFFRMSTVTIMYHAEIVGGQLRSSIEGSPSWHDEAELRRAAFPGKVLPHILDDYLRFRRQPVSSGSSD